MPEHPCPSYEAALAHDPARTLDGTDLSALPRPRDRAKVLADRLVERSDLRGYLLALRLRREIGRADADGPAKSWSG